MVRQITDMETWLLDNDNKVFRYVVYRRMYTPYEQKQAFIDETFYEDTHYNLGYIEEAIDMGDGEWVIGFRNVCDGDETDLGRIDYYKLSEIRLSCFDIDQNNFEEDDDERE